MGRPTMHRLVALVPVAVTLALATPAAAQSASPSPQPEVGRLTLLEQTPWNSPSDPTLDLRFRATNLGEQTLEPLTIGVTLFGRVISRTAYEESLQADPIPAVVIVGETLAQEDGLAPGQSRDFEVSLDLALPGIDSTQSGIYPLKVDLRSAGVPVAALRTPVIYLVRRPEEPLRLSWTFVLSAPICFRPDGVFDSPALQDSLAPGGRLQGEIRALAALAEKGPVPVDIATSPVLLTQLARMRDGYEIVDVAGSKTVPAGQGGAKAAADALTALRGAVAPSEVSLSALPFSAPQVPSLLSSDLGRDLDTQLELGRQVVQTLLDRAADPTVLRPPDAVLDETSLDALSARGLDLLLTDAGTVQTPLQPLGFAPPPVAALRPDGQLSGIVPDAAVAALLASPGIGGDPVLGAHAVLGETAAIWQQQPGEVRGLALSVPEQLQLPGAFFGPFVREVASAPWLRPVSARGLAEAFPPKGVDALAPAVPQSFEPGYVAGLKQARRRIDVYASMLVGESTEPQQMDTKLLLAESGTFLSDPTRGRAFITSVRDTVGATFASVTANAGDLVTLTSRSGSRIPVHVANGSAQPLRVAIALVSQYLVNPPARQMVLPAGSQQTITFDVDLKTTGRFPVIIQVVAPAGRVINQSSVIVRSTAYSRVALIITIAAALMLVALWTRRFLPRRTT